MKLKGEKKLMKIHIARFTILMTFFTLLIAGCNSKSDELYQDFIQKGLDAVAEDDYGKAEGFFEMALENKSGDETAEAYLMQVQNMIQANKFVDDEKFNDAIELLNQTIEMENGSKVIASKAEEEKQRLEKQQENEQQYASLLKDAKKLNESSDYQESNKVLDELLQSDLNDFPTLKDEAYQLKDANNGAIKDAEIAEAKKAAERAAKEKAEKEKQKNDPFAWAPGVKEKFEKDMIERGYVEPDGPFIYKEGYIGGDGHGYYSLYTIIEELGEVYVVTVNVKTGWYHG